MVAVKMGGPMPPMGGMPQPMNMMPPPMPVPPMGNPMMPPQSMPMQQGTAPVAPIMRSNAGRRKRFGDSLEGMLATTRPPPVASDQMGGMNVFTGQMPRRQMPRGQMMGGTAMQPPVRRMMGGGPVSVPRQTDIYGQPHMLAYINPEEADLLQGLGGMGTPGPGGVPQYNWFSDFISSITGGGSSSSSGGGQDNNPNAGDGGGSANRTSTSTSNANQAYADSMIAGGGGTNLRGSGSTAMEKLLADQQAQTQKDSAPPQSQDPMDYINQQYYKQQEEQRKNDEIRAAREAEAKAVREAEAAAEAASLAAQEASFNQPDTQVNTGVIGGYDTIGTGSVNDPLGSPDDASNIDIFTTGDVVPIGDPSDASNIDLLTTLPVTGGDDNTSPNEQEPISLDPVFYDMFGNKYKTQAEAQAADAEHLRKQQAAADAEAEKQKAQAAAEEAARIQAEAAAREQRLRDERTAAASSGMNPLTAYGGMSYPESEDAFLGVGPIELTDPRGDEANVMTNYLTDPITDPINTGLGDKSLDKAVTDATEGTDDRNFIQKFIDDIKDVPGNIVSDITMALDAGLFGGYDKMIENLKNAKNPDGTPKYTQAEIDDYIKRTKDTQQKQREKQERESAQDDDGGSKSIVDPCPDGFKLDSASGICVPVEEDDTEEDSGDDKEEDTSDDELSGVVTTPPPPTSYLDNPIRMIDRPVRTMNRGGSVGLNRAADNFLAAMGA